jgi:hypothetical protein
MELKPLPKGGISFMFVPCEQYGTYRYWVSFCPADIPFSSSVATKKLKLAYESGTVEWGTFNRNEDQPILDTALAHLLSEASGLHSEIPITAFETMLKNIQASLRMHKTSALAESKTLESYDKNFV